MAPPKRDPPKAQPSYARLNPFLRGVIYGMFLAGCSVTEIQDEIEKQDGASPSRMTISRTCRCAARSGGASWDGSTPSGAGRPRSMTAAEEKNILKIVFQQRGSVKVTTEYLRKVIPSLRKYHPRTVQRRWCDACP